jgi:hypothetical protein
VQWTQPPKRQKRSVKVKLVKVQLRRNQQAHQHSHDPPNDGGPHEVTDGLIIEFDDGFGSVVGTHSEKADLFEVGSMG